MPIDYALLTDLYEITMAQGYRDSGHENTEACFHMYFRDTPFKGGYAIACGMAQLADMVDTYAFSGEDIDYLSKIPAPGGGALFAADFLEWLRDFKLTVDIDAVPEGQVVFPNEPLVRVKGPIMQCQLLEAALLNCVNFQTLIATKAARVCLAAQDAPVAEFGLRRAQGPDAGLYGARAALIAGCGSTSNVLAGKMFDVPVAESLDLKKAAKAVGEKSIEMLHQKELLPLTGYVHGGCSPVGMKKLFPTVFHSSVENLPTVIVSAGKIGYQVEVKPADLMGLVRAETADIIVE